MSKTDQRNIIMGFTIFYLVCTIVFILFLYLNNRRVINLFEDYVKNSYVLKEKYGNIRKIKFKNPFNYGKAVNDEYIMTIKITNDQNKTYVIDIIDGKLTNSMVGFIINGERFTEYESFNLDDYQDKIENNNVKNQNVGEFNNYQELFNKIKILFIELYGEKDNLAYKIYYDKNKSTYLIETYFDEQCIVFLIKEKGNVLSIFEIERG